MIPAKSSDGGGYNLRRWRCLRFKALQESHTYIKPPGCAHHSTALICSYLDCRMSTRMWRGGKQQGKEGGKDEEDVKGGGRQRNGKCLCRTVNLWNYSEHRAYRFPQLLHPSNLLSQFLT